MNIDVLRALLKDVALTEEQRALLDNACCPFCERDFGYDPEKYHKEWRQGEGRERFNASIKKWFKNNPEKSRAYDRVEYALRVGKLVKGPCEQLAPDCHGRIEAHHDDYSKPLEVRWLCKRHHKKADAARRKAESSGSLLQGSVGSRA